MNPCGPDRNNPPDAAALGAHQTPVEEALKKSEERFRSLIRNASDAVTVYDAEGTVRYVSPSIERMLGYEPEERIGSKSFDLIHHDDVERAKAKFAEALRKPNLPICVEVRVRHKDGSWRYVEVVGTNLLSDPSVRGIVLNWRDVTERKQAEEELGFRKALLEAQSEASIDGILAVSDDRRILSFNRRFVEMWEIPEEVVETRLAEVVLRAALNRVADPEEFLAESFICTNTPMRRAARRSGSRTAGPSTATALL